MPDSFSTTCDLCQEPTSSDQLITIAGKQVCATCKPDAVMNLKSGVGLATRVSPERAEEIRRQLRFLNLMSFAFGAPGLLLAFGSGAIRTPNNAAVAGAAALLWFVGIVLFTVGMVFYARMKGRHGALGLFGLLSCIGLLALHYFPKCCHNCRARASYRAKECNSCGAPV